MKSALKSTALTTTCLACKQVHRWAHCTELLHTHTVELHGLLSCMHEYYQYSERVAILHSLHMRSEHVVSQELHSTDYTQARCKKIRDQGVKLMWSCRPNLWPPAMKRQDTVLRFRLLASRFSFQLMWVWAGIMLLGLGTMHYKQINGEKVKCEGILKYFIFWYLIVSLTTFIQILKKIWCQMQRLQQSLLTGCTSLVWTR